MLLLNEEDIRKVFSMKDAIGSNKKAYGFFSAGKAVVPLREVIHDDKQNSDFLFMPAYVADMKAAAVKIVNIFPGNAAKGDATTKGQVVLIDGENGGFKAIMDGTFITSFRTGAASGAAFDLFGRSDAKVGALIGTGGQARCQLEAMLAARDLDEVRVSARNYEKTKKFVEEMSGIFTDVRLVACESGDEAVDGADLIIAVTVSGSPTFSADKVKKGAVISGVGSYRPEMQELDPELFKRASKIYFDSKDACLAESGDIQRPLKDGVITEKDFTGDIGEYINGQIPGRENDDEIIVFKNVGIGVLDLVTAEDIYDAYNK